MGPLVAKALGAPFIDLDRVIADRVGKTISQIFAETGESRFRALERDEMRRALAGKPCVIAAGGGWAAQPGNLASVETRALTVYLRVSPEVAASRTAATPDTRPLLSGGDAGTRLVELLRAREVFYQRSEATVDAGALPPASVAQEVANLARSLGGWY